MNMINTSSVRSVGAKKGAKTGFQPTASLKLKPASSLGASKKATVASPSLAENFLSDVLHDLNNPKPLGSPSLHQQARHLPPNSHALDELQSLAERKGAAQGTFPDISVSRESASSSPLSEPGAPCQRIRSSLGVRSPTVLEDELFSDDGAERSGVRKSSFAQELEVSASTAPLQDHALVQDLRSPSPVLETQLSPKLQVSAKAVDMSVLPEVFKRRKSGLPRKTDSPFSSALPLPRVAAPCKILRQSEDLHEEGIRRLRHRDFEGARQAFESAWEMLSSELQIQADEHAKLLEVEADNSDDSEGTKRRRHEKNRNHARLYKVRMDDQRKLGKEHKIALGLDLTLSHCRLKEWEKVDEICALVLDVFGPPDEIPEFVSEEDETRWGQLMVRRGVACLCLGSSHFGRADACFFDVISVIPGHRDAKRGSQCVHFLEDQMLPKESYSAIIEALSSF